jgi:RHS repeat-associated protein
VTQGSINITFYYEPTFNRVKKVAGSGTTIFLGKLYEKVVTASVTEHKHYIAAGSATVIYTQRSSGANDTRYLLPDHLGSPETITDESGAVIQRLSYDAWGKPRNTDWTDATGPINAQTTRGFTGHTMDSEIDLVDMNARLYDPVLGRFISADTYVEASFGQGLNRYTYCSNNSLSYIDPTGHWVQAVAAVMAIYAAVRAGRQAKKAGGDSLDVFSAAFMAGGMSYASSVAFQGVGQLTSTWTSFAGEYIAKPLLHGTVGGMFSVAQGGSFKDGFVGAAVPAAASSAIGLIGNGSYDPRWAVVRSLTSGLVGGYAAKASGGSFETGFVMGTLMHANNHESGGSKYGYQETSWTPLVDFFEGVKNNYEEIPYASVDDINSHFSNRGKPSWVVEPWLDSPNKRFVLCVVNSALRDVPRDVTLELGEVNIGKYAGKAWGHIAQGVKIGFKTISGAYDVFSCAVQNSADAPHQYYSNRPSSIFDLNRYSPGL